MAVQNCWEVIRCGREPHGPHAAERGICPVTTFIAADGLCGGRNGGRACHHIRELMLARGTISECDGGECQGCAFLLTLEVEHAAVASVEAFLDHICHALGTGTTPRMLRMLFGRDGVA